MDRPGSLSHLIPRTDSFRAPRQRLDGTGAAHRDPVLRQRIQKIQKQVIEHLLGERLVAGQAADIDIYAREILRMREILNGMLADATGQPVERVAKDVDRDYIMEPDQAVIYGMIDRVITSRDLTPISIKG